MGTREDCLEKEFTSASFLPYVVLFDNIYLQRKDAMLMEKRIDRIFDWSVRDGVSQGICQ